MSDFWKGVLLGSFCGVFTLLALGYGYLFDCWMKNRKQETVDWSHKAEPIGYVDSVTADSEGIRFTGTVYPSYGSIFAPDMKVSLHEGGVPIVDRRHDAQFEDFDIDFNQYAVGSLDPEAPVVEYTPRYSFLPEHWPEQDYVKYCGNQNPDESAPYRCTRRRGHVESTEPHQKRHGYGGVFWD